MTFYERLQNQSSLEVASSHFHNQKLVFLFICLDKDFMQVSKNDNKRPNMLYVLWLLVYK